MHVLLAEDNDLNAEIAVSLLEEQGMIVTRAADGKSTLAQFCNTDPGTFESDLDGYYDAGNEWI